MLLKRTIEASLIKALFQEKVVIIYGPRQVGKTTLLKQIADRYSDKRIRFFNCDEPDVRNDLTNKTSTELKKYVGDAELVFIDEAQRVENIGLTLKLFADNYPQIQIVATGSSSFDLANKINEPLTGRKIELNLFPFSSRELLQMYNQVELDRMLENLLIFGQYPASIFSRNLNTAKTVSDLANSYLYKDIFELERLRRPELVVKLLQALALQVGQEVSYTELASLLKVDKKTIERYIVILERAFIVFRLRPFARNLRNEMSTKRKIFFYDLGIRNSLVNNFNPLNMRNDVGALWENFCIVERLKNNSNDERMVNSYFWRTTIGQREVDYVEEAGGVLSGFEFKWNKSNFNPPAEFLKYLGSSVRLVNRDNYQDFLLDG